MVKILKLPLYDQKDAITDPQGYATFRLIDGLNDTSRIIQQVYTDLSGQIETINTIGGDLADLENTLLATIDAQIHIQLDPIEAQLDALSDLADELGPLLASGFPSFKGEWVSVLDDEKHYGFDDVVTHNGHLWMNIAESPEEFNDPEIEPGTDSTVWYLMPTLIDDLTDVLLTSAASGQVLTYNGSQWINQDVLIPLDDLTDVVLTAPSSGDALIYNGTNWVNADPSLSLDQLSDVVLTSPVVGQTLTYNGTQWVNQLPAYTMPFSFNTSADPNEVIFRQVFIEKVTIAASFAGWAANVGTNPASTYTFTIYKNTSTSIGTIAISSSGVVTVTQIGSGAMVFNSGDLITVVAPAASSTLANMAFTFKGVRG